MLACTSTKHEDSDPMPPPAKQTPGSAEPAAPTVTPIVHLTTAKGDLPIKVEVVATEPKIEKGLMYRQHLPLDSGMLFMMGREHQWSFWMRNTLISLDIIFITKEMTIAGIAENAKPLDESLLKVDKPSLYVLEVNGGLSKTEGIVAGAQVRFENVPAY